MSDDTKNLFDRVLFESDRTCCICRDKAKPVIIHHIDEDHSNNERSNLAVVCKNCHTLIHSSIQFCRALTPGQVRLYDKTWRERCSDYLLLPQKDQQDQSEYHQEVILEVSLACHGWKNSYMALYPGHFRHVKGNFTDIWETLQSGSHAETPEEWSHYQPLFQEEIPVVVNNLQQILACHAEALPVKLKTLVLRTIRQLQVEGMIYSMSGSSHRSVKSAVTGVLDALSNLARAADSQTSASPVVPWHE